MITNFQEIAERIRTLRELLGISPKEMADTVGYSTEDYLRCENGEVDFTFTFLHKCAEKFQIDIVELLTGDTPKLSYYTVTRKGEGLPLNRRKGFTYQHLSYLFKNKVCEPFEVLAPYSEEEQNSSIHLSTHEGQEFDYVLEGSLKCCVDGHVEVLRPGDSIYYDSGKPHGMIATGGAPCRFLAIVMKKR